MILLIIWILDSQEIKNQFMSAQRTSTNRNEFDSPKKESAYRYFEKYILIYFLIIILAQINDLLEPTDLSQ